MIVKHNKCPNCGASVSINHDAGSQTLCQYCQTPLSVQAASPHKSHSKQRSVQTITQSNRSKTKNPPVLFIAAWLMSCIFMSIKIFENDASAMALVPLFMGIFGTYQMIKKRKDKKHIDS